MREQFKSINSINVVKLSIYILGSLAALIGAIVMAGWFTNNSALIRIHPQFNTMKFNTALSFYLGGIALVFIFHPRRVISRSCGSFLIIFGFLTLLEYIFNVNLRIDQFLINDHFTAVDQFPGRMSPQTALCFLLLGMTIILERFINMNLLMFLRCIVGAFLLVIGSTAIFGFIFNVPFAYSWGSYNALAFHTALGFIFLGTAMMLTAAGNVYLSLALTAIGGLSIGIQVYYGLVQSDNAELKYIIPRLLLGTILLFTAFLVLYIYTQIRRRIIIEEQVGSRTQELQELNRKLQEAMRIKSEFTSMVSHELRTPLTVIKESVAIVQDGTAGAVSDEQKDFLETAKRNIDRLTRLINDVLDYQKLEAQHMEFRMEPNDINAVVLEVGRSFSIPLRNKSLDLNFKLQNHLPQINFDRDKIIQVLTNLLNNAMKFTEFGTITLISEPLGDNAVKISVKDEGMGIKPEDQNLLFQSFSQISTGKSRQSGGTGLGLALSKKIVENHRGKIGVVSQLGEGSTFYFILPVRERRTGIQGPLNENNINS